MKTSSNAFKEIRHQAHENFFRRRKASEKPRVSVQRNWTCNYLFRAATFNNEEIIRKGLIELVIN